MLKGKNIEKANVLYHLLCGVKDKAFKMSYTELNILARTVGNSLFDMHPTWSGYMSKQLVNELAIDPSTKKCAEHYYPRQVAGWRIVEHIMRYRGIKKAKLISLLIIFNQVHYTTAAENTALVPFQKYGTFTTPEYSYAAAGIELVQVKVV